MTSRKAMKRESFKPINITQKRQVFNLMGLKLTVCVGQTACKKATTVLNATSMLCLEIFLSCLFKNSSKCYFNFYYKPELSEF